MENENTKGNPNAEGAIQVEQPTLPEAVSVGDFLVLGGTLGEDFRYRDRNNQCFHTDEDGVLVILSDKCLTIKNRDLDTPTEDTILIEDGVNAKLTLAGVNIDVSHTGSYHEPLFQSAIPGFGPAAPVCTPGKAALRIADGSNGHVTIRLASARNILKSGCAHAGLEKNGKSAGTLTIEGPGSLHAEGGDFGAGIGGGSTLSKAGHARKIRITRSGFNGAATITAIGRRGGAGIGGGYNGDGIQIKINSAAVTAISDEGAGIGGGLSGSAEVAIRSAGVFVTALSANGGQGIGCGRNGQKSQVYIDRNCTVTATGLGGGNEEKICVKKGGAVTILSPRDHEQTSPDGDLEQEDFAGAEEWVWGKDEEEKEVRFETFPACNDDDDDLPF